MVSPTRPEIQDSGFRTDVILSLRTGWVLSGVTEDSVCKLAAHLTGTTIADRAALDEVRWVCHASLHDQVDVPIVREAPTYFDSYTDFEEWQRQLAIEQLRRKHVIKPARDAVPDSAENFPTAEALINAHPIVLWDLVTFLTLVKNPGFRRSLGIALPWTAVSEVHDDLDDSVQALTEIEPADGSGRSGTLAAKPDDERFRAWLSMVIQVAYDIRVVANLAKDAVADGTNDPGRVSRVTALPHPTLVTLLVEELDSATSAAAGVTARGLFRLRPGAAEGAAG